jgi:hypothetical protein
MPAMRRIEAPAKEADAFQGVSSALCQSSRSWRMRRIKTLSSSTR